MIDSLKQSNTEIEFRIYDDITLNDTLESRQRNRLNIFLGLRMGSVADPDPNPDPPDHDFGPPGSGSISQKYGSGSFYHHAKIVGKP
jgi:hypothetical protein